MTPHQKLTSKMANTGIIVFLIGFAFAIIETLYFGSNWMPESRAEFICDAYAAKISGAGMGIWIYSWWLKLN